MSALYPQIAVRLFNTPLLLDARKASIIGTSFAPRVFGYADRRQDDGKGFAKAERPRGRFGPLQEWCMADRQGGHPYLFHVKTGIAVIEIEGSLAHRQHHLGRSSGVTGYDGIAAQLQSAIEAPEVKGVILDVDSPGGEVFGAFDLAERVFKARSTKPIIAVADELAASAAYLIASAADEVFLASQVSEVGSVGVIMIHFDLSGQLAELGIQPTIIKAGARKADGNPYQNLPEDVRARFQGDVDRIYGLFVEAVAKHRGLNESQVRGTEAAVFAGDLAVSAGLANKVASPREVFDAFAATLKGTPAAIVAA